MIVLRTLVAVSGRGRGRREGEVAGVRIALLPQASAADREHRFWEGMCSVNPDIEHWNYATFELQDRE